MTINTYDHKDEMSELMLDNVENKSGGLRILVVDDDDLNQRLLDMALSKDGHSLSFSYDGYDALKVLEEKVYDLVFMDMTIPRVNGFEVCEHIRGGDFPNKTTPMIALTALPSKDKQLQDFLDRGMFNECVHKPFDIDHIKKILELAAEEKDIGFTPKQPDDSGFADVERPVLAIDNVLPIFHNDLDTYKGLLVPFMNGLPARLQEMQAAESSHDWDALARSGHNLTGVARNFGAEKLSFLAEQLDIKAGKKDVEAVQQLIEEIEACVFELETACASLTTKNS